MVRIIHCRPSSTRPPARGLHHAASKPQVKACSGAAVACGLKAETRRLIVALQMNFAFDHLAGCSVK